MDFKRILANAVARRVALVLVAAVFAWLGLGNARAADLPDAGAAYQACMARVEVIIAQSPNNRRVYSGTCSHNPNVSATTAGYECKYQAKNYADEWVTIGICNNDRWYYYPKASTCGGRPNYVGAPPYSTMSGFPVQGAMSCVDGCVASWYNNGDGTWTGSYGGGVGNICTPHELKEDCASMGTGYAWNSYAGLCQPPKKNCEANQTQDAVTGECKDSCPAGMVMDAQGVCAAAEDDCPAGNVKAPSGECLPGDGQCAAGEARRPNGTCGKDSDGDGEADEDDEDPENDPDKETASGGDSCDSPPSCSGGAIACMQVKIQWRIDCNTRKSANVTGGTCGAVPVCAGKSCDALEYAQLLQQWKSACALEALASGAGGGGDGVVELLTGPGSINSNAGGGDSLEDGNPWSEEGEEHEPDASGYGWSRSCPSPPSFSLPGGQSVQIDFTPLCNWVSLGGTLVLILAGLMSLRIVAGGAA